MIAEYLRNQAARCMSLARVCFDLETARQLRLLGDDLKAKAEEVEGKARLPSRTMQQQMLQQQQQQQRKDRPALAKLVTVQGFFWLKEEGNAAGKKTGIEALATALSLAAKDGSGWEMLGEFAADETAQPYPDRPNTVCSPAGPEFDVAALEKLAETTKTDVGDWGFTATDGVEVRATAAQNSAVIEKLGMAFVRVMPDMAPNASQDFMRVVAPSGKVGFVAAEAINPLGSDQLCYGKDASGAWKIVGMIGGE